MLSPQPRSTAPHTGPSYTHLCPPSRTLSPPSFSSPSLSCPDRLLAWRGWRRSPMEALVNFHIHKKTKQKKNREEMAPRGARDVWLRYASCRLLFLHVSFHLNSPQPYALSPLFPFPKSQAFCSVSIEKAKDLQSTCRGVRHDFFCARMFFLFLID